MHKEIWKDIQGYEGFYQVSNLGRIKSKRDNHGKLRDKILKAGKNPAGYLGITLYRKTIKEQRSVHGFVSESFIPNPRSKPQINHKNGIKHDNRAINLEWVTPKENVRHSLEVLRNHTNLQRKGENHPLSKLNNKSVSLIKMLIKENNITQVEIGKMFGISSHNIRSIKMGRLWKHIQPAIPQISIGFC